MGRQHDNEEVEGMTNDRMNDDMMNDDTTRTTHNDDTMHGKEDE